MRFSLLRLAVLGLAMLIAVPRYGLAGAGGPASPGPMSISVNPTHMDPTGSATVTATLTGAALSCGTITIQYEIYSDISKTTVVATWAPLASGTPSGGVFSAIFDGNAIAVTAGEVVSFRAGFVTGGSSGGPNCTPGAYGPLDIGNSPTVDLLIDTASGAVCPNDQTTGVYVAIENASGVGEPPAGFVENWSFDVTITACEHVYDVTAQGGDNGWSSTVTCTPDVVSSGSDSTCTQRKINKKNRVWVWSVGTTNGYLGEMQAGAKAKATVAGSGTFTTSQCGAIKYLNGDWSALYATTEGGPKTKSAYSVYDATIQVTCP